MSNGRNKKKKQQFRVNLGTIVFFVLLVYIIIQILISLSKDNLTIYEVQNSYIDTNISSTALIVREEQLVSAESSGYVSYFVRDGQKVGCNKTVYTIDETGSVYAKLKDENSEDLVMSDDALNEIRTRISNYENYFDYSNYSDIYNFRYDIENAVLELTNEALIDKMTSLKDGDGARTYREVAAKEAGIITYYKDGFEDFDLTSFKASDVDKNKYEKTTLKTGDIINKGDPVYKVITSENWYLVAPITDEDAKNLKDKETVLVNIHNSAKNVRCKINLTKKDDKNFAVLSLNQQMVNYINDRYIDIVILMDQNNGLKIPNSSIVKKECIKIPIKYLTAGSDSNEKIYLNVNTVNKKGEMSYNQVSPTVLKRDDDFIYVDPLDFETTTVISIPGTSDSLAFADAEKVKIDGVYSVNTGITDFVSIEIIYSDDEYSIVKSGLNYSLEWYDRIILDSDKVEENQIIR